MCTIMDLPPELLLDILKRLDGQGMAAVCTVFRRIYHDNATTAVITRGYNQGEDRPILDALNACAISASRACHLRGYQVLCECMVDALSLPAAAQCNAWLLSTIAMVLFRSNFPVLHSTYIKLVSPSTERTS